MEVPTVPAVPPIPRQSRQQSRRKEQQAPPSLHTLPRHDRGLTSANGLRPASPEVISSLITSLDHIAKSGSGFDDSIGTNPTFSAPGSPTTGSFGVDYGAFSTTNLADTLEEGLSLDELAASPPVIRTAKPPSGFSPLTAPKSPREGNGLKSILGGGRGSASRPSSKGSLASRDADTQSIGNLSIERGPVSPPPELKRKSSKDSWGKKTGRAHKGLMYMSSKERLREKEAERKRASIGAVGGGRLSSDRATEPKPDPFLAELTISEEPHSDSSKHQHRPSPDNGAPSPRTIPTRDSSLRKTGSNAKRSSRRSSKRNSESTDIIHEIEESHSSRSREPSRRKQPTLREDGESNMGAEVLLDRSKMASTRGHDTWNNKPLPHKHTNEDDVEDGAPFPAVAQGRRRDRSGESRTMSGRHTPDPLELVHPKRSGSKVKRHSGPLSPRANEERLNSMLANGGHAASDDPNAAANVSYERPQSADSIDDAVESYLCSPRLSQKIRHPQTGRVISFSEVGDSEGSAVFCCVGMGLTRYITAFYDELALTLKLRLITPDRPGVGDSEPYTDGTATPLSWPGR